MIGTMTYRSQNWLVNKTDGANWFFQARITGSHSMKFGYQGNWWKDDRGEFTNNQSLAYTLTGGTRLANGTFVQAAELDHAVREPVLVNARAMTSFFAQDQWTIKRLTLRVHCATTTRGAGSPPSPSRRAGSSPGQLRPAGRRNGLPRHRAADGPRLIYSATEGPR